MRSGHVILPGDVLQRHLAHDLQRVLDRFAAEDPVHVFGVARHGRLAAAADAILDTASVIVDRAPRDRTFEALLERGGARRIVTAEGQGDDADSLGVDIRTRLEVVHRRTGRSLRIRTAREPLQAQRGADAGMIDDEKRDPAPPEFLGDGRVDDLLGHVETVEMHDARCAAGHRRLRKQRRQSVFAEGYLDLLDRLLAADKAAREDFDPALVHFQPSRIRVARHALRKQIVDARAQVLRPAESGCFASSSARPRRSTRSASFIQLSNHARCCV